MRSRCLSMVFAVAFCHVSLTHALGAYDPREIVAAKRKELEIKRQEQVGNQSQRHVADVRDLERMWNLPPNIAAAVADGRISFEALEFTGDNRLIVNRRIPSALTQRPTGVVRESHLMLRTGGLSISVLLLLVGLAIERRRAVEAVVSCSSRKHEKERILNIEE